MKAKPKTLENRVQKTITYLNSEPGWKNWWLNFSRGYSTEANLIAAIQTATRLIKYETIIQVLYEVKCHIRRQRRK